MRRLLLLLVVGLLALGAVACGDDDEQNAGSGTPTAAPAADACAPGKLPLTTAGTLTVGTDKPAYPPYFEDDDPANGKGFESAVAYAVADKLGLPADKVKWTVVPFNSSYAPGPKSFDFDINQISISPARAKNVDFSEPYYNVNQALVAIKGTPLTKAKTLAEVKDAKLGAQIGTTSLDYINDEIQPSKKASVYNTNTDVISALKAKQIDGIVVDLPTGFYVVAAEVPNGTIVGQFPAAGEQEQFGLVLAKDSPLTACVDEAVTALRDDGTLDTIQQEWLADKANAPVLE